MATSYDKLSDHQNAQLKADVSALSLHARQKNVRGASGAFTQNSTVKTQLGPLGFAGTLKSGYFSFTQLPAGGALSIKIVAYDRSADAEIVLTDAADPETGTVREGKALVLATTNVALDADDTIEVHTIADNNAVGTAAAGGFVSLMFDPVEQTVLSF
jgi:hypothetical protein